MGKRGGGDAKKLAELQAALKEKAEAEKANLTNMDPPPPPKKKKKKKTAEPPLILGMHLDTIPVADDH